MFFDSSLVYARELGAWSPFGVGVVDPIGVPLLNTVILLRRAVIVTRCHSKILSNDGGAVELGLGRLLGAVFLFFQFKEYRELSFGMSDSIYGRIFYLSTGFHGGHVMIGTIYLILNLYRLVRMHFNWDHHLRLEFSIIYWHFVDVV